MDWQTKEYIDSRFDELEEKINSILKHFDIETTEEDFEEETTEEDIVEEPKF